MRSPALPDSPVDAPVLAVWVLLQLASLAVSLLHVPLAASFPPGERLAVEVLLAVQISSAAVLSPALLRTVGTTLLTAATAWPALLLAGASAARPVTTTAAAATVLMLWLATLWTWRQIADQHGLAGIVGAAGTLASAGSAMLAYLATEFGEPTSNAAVPPLACTPILLAWKLATTGTLLVPQCIPLVIALCLGLCLQLVSNRQRFETLIKLRFIHKQRKA